VSSCVDDLAVRLGAIISRPEGKFIEQGGDNGITSRGPVRGGVDFEGDAVVEIETDVGHAITVALIRCASIGTLSSKPLQYRGVHTGNLDNRDLSAGTTLFMPIYTPGALFSVGDAHAAQGQGEVDLTAIETGLRGKFQFIVRKDMKITWPRGETPTHWIVMGLNPNLEEAMKMAVRETILFITQRFPKLSREEAYMIASIAVDYHVTQVVDGTKGIHGMIPKAIFTSQ
jgi:acetamidase/formamidase